MKFFTVYFIIFINFLSFYLFKNHFVQKPFRFFVLVFTKDRLQSAVTPGSHLDSAHPNLQCFQDLHLSETHPEALYRTTPTVYVLPDPISSLHSTLVP